jgi:hypothetical protein
VNITGIFNALVSHGMSTGLFERVNQHEPKNAPGNGLTMAVWLDRVTHASGSSGLNNTTGLLVFSVRVFSNMVAEPQDDIDPTLLTAIDALFTAYSGDFELGGLVRDVDLMGQHGAPLEAAFGYVPIDNKMYRVGTIVVPLVVNDAWAQSP